MALRRSHVHVILRFLSLLFLVSTALVVGLDSQTKVVIASIERKATVKDLKALWVLTVVASAAAAYNLLQLTNSFLSTYSKRYGAFGIKFEWFSLLLDQVVVYVVFAANSAAIQGSVIAVTGVNSLQWLKMCNTYTRFCVQIGGGILCGFVASILMAVVTSFSAFNLFRFYSSSHFLELKSRR